MKKNAFIFFLFLTNCLYSQTNDSIYNSKIDLGFSFSPDYCDRILKIAADENWMKEFYDTLEVSRFAYTAGLNAVFHLSDHFFLGTGLLFSDRGEKTKKYSIQPVNNYLNHYYYLSMPVKASYYLSNKRIKLFISAGFLADIYLKGHSISETGSSGEKKTIGLSSKMSRLSFSFIGSAGLDCPLTARWYLRFEPVYRRSITSVSDSPLKKYFYSVGLNMGVFYRF